MAKTTTEKISSIEEEIAQLENRKKLLLKTQSEENRKARTKRLIVRGATAEKLLGVGEEVSDREFEALLAKALCLTDDFVQESTFLAEQAEM